MLKKWPWNACLNRRRKKKKYKEKEKKNRLFLKA
jgi:hypothetical protein